MRFKLLLSAMVLGLCAAPRAGAEMVQVQAVMDGLQSVPTTPSPGTGLLTMNLDTSSGILSMVSGHYENLIGFVFAAHVHGYAPPGEKAGVLFTMVNSGGTTGILGLPGGQIQLKEADVQGMLAGLTYISLHTTVFGAGEIRGQIYVVPGAGSLACFGLILCIGHHPRRRALRI